jgi:hypothetical protein
VGMRSPKMSRESTSVKRNRRKGIRKGGEEREPPPPPPDDEKDWEVHMQVRG